MKSVRSYVFLAFLFIIHCSNAQVSPVAASSLELTGTNFVSIPDNNLLDLNTNTTFEGWYNFCSEGMIFSKNYCNYEAGYYLFVEPTGSVRLLAIYDNTCNAGISLLSNTPAVYSFNEWHHFALTVSISSGNTQFQLFMDHDPVPAINQTVGWVANNNTEPLRIGTYRSINGTMGLFPQGRICDFRVYDHLVPFNNQCLASPVSNPFLRLEMQSGSGSAVPSSGSLSASLFGTNVDTGSSPITANYLSTTPLFDPTIQTTGPFSNAGPLVQFAANSSGGTWSSDCGSCMSSAGVFNPQNAGEGTFQICYTTGSGICTDQDCQTIIVNGCTQTTNESHSICPGDTYTFNGQNFTAAGAYPFVFTGQNGCDSTHTLNLSVFTVNPTSQLLTPCEGDSVLVEGNWYLESDNIVNPITDANGCLATHTYQIVFNDCSIEDYAVYIANTFTPNDDNTNDFFSISIMGGYLVEGFIVNRWGNIIKEFHVDDLKWDGLTNEGMPVQDGVYTYVFVVSSNQGQKTKYHGFVTVLR